MTGKEENTVHQDHMERINIAVSFIDLHLDQELSLDKVAGAAFYSAFHFHRVFKAVMGEPLNVYISRKRIEKAAAVLMRKKEVTITELSMQYGFNGNSAFTRAFKKFYGMSPTQFRHSSPGKFSKISKTDSKNGKVKVFFEPYICGSNDQKTAYQMNTNITIKELPDMELAYISSIGQANLKGTYDRLMQWSAEKGLLRSPGFKLLTIYHDSFKITAPDQVRMSACIQLTAPLKTEGEVGLTRLEKGKCVVARYELFSHEFGRTWTELYVWLNKNGYKTTARNCFEIYHSDPEQHPEKKFTVDFCIPIA